MINSKYITPMAIVAIVLSAIIVVAAILFNPVNDVKVVQAESPEYIAKILDKNQVSEINIEIKENDWAWLLENARNEEYRSCNVTINGTTFNNVGIRPKGNSSLNMVAGSSTTNRYSFKLDFDEYVEGQTCYGLPKLALNNIMSDKTYMKEYLSYDLFDYMGVAAPAYGYTHIKVNGEEWGLYLAVEVMDESFVQRHYGSLAGNLYKPDNMEMGGGNKADIPPINEQKANRTNNSSARPNAEKEPGINNASHGEMGMKANGEQQLGKPAWVDNFSAGGMGGGSRGANLKYTGDDLSNYSAIRESAVFKTTSDEDFKKVIKMIKRLNEGGNLEEYLDVDEVLRYFAVNTFLVNLDSYAGGMYHNYYLYEENGVLQILPWDFNMSFAGFRINDASKAINFPIDNPVTGNLDDAPLIGKLLEVPKYKEIYHQYLKQIVENYINSGIYANTIVKVEQLIDDYVKNDATAFNTYQEYKKSIPVLQAFGKDRAKSITAQLNGTQPAATYGNIATTVDLSALGGMGKGGSENPMGIPEGEKSGDMPNRENMQEAIKIFQEANGQELTAEQKNRLSELGVDENMVNVFRSRGRNKVIPPGGALPVNESGLLNPDSSLRNALLIVSMVFLLGGLLFVSKFKRKKYNPINSKAK